MTRGRPEQLEVALRHLSGSARAFLDHFNPAQLNSGADLQWHSTMHDVHTAERLLADMPREQHVLTRREYDVARQIWSGRTQKEISRLMRVSIKTVDSHVVNLRKKLGVRKSADIAVLFEAGKIICDAHLKHGV